MTQCMLKVGTLAHHHLEHAVNFTLALLSLRYCFGFIRRLIIRVAGTFRCTQAAWKVFRKQKYGRVVMTSSASGLFGNFGQVNYSAAKLGVYGLAETLAKEGVKYNILVNAIAPVAASAMTATIMTPALLEHLNPIYVSPLVAYLVHAGTKENGLIFEVGAGHVSKFRWERSPGAVLKCKYPRTMRV